MYSPLYSDYIPMFIFYSRFKLIGKSLCQICETNVNTQFKLLHMFDYHGIFICNNNRCIVSAQETIDDIFTEHPIYNLNLNRNDIKYPNDNIILSSIKPENSKLNLNQESIGSTYLVKDNFYIILFDEMAKSTFTDCKVFDLKEIYEANDFSDEETSFFPDPVKEYLGIPLNSSKLNSIQLHFVD